MADYVKFMRVFFDNVIKIIVSVVDYKFIKKPKPDGGHQKMSHQFGESGE
jgi:hypothetical protein